MYKHLFDSYVEQFKNSHGIEVHCISDRILLYLRYAENKCQLLSFFGFNDEMMNLYYRIRGDPDYTNSNPRGIAAAIFYTACVKRIVNMTQKQVGEVFNISEATVRSHYLWMKQELKL